VPVRRRGARGTAADAGLRRRRLAGLLAGIGPGQRYGHRVDGPYDPGAGHRCNPAKLLLDPYARAIDGDVRWEPSLLGTNSSDSAGATPRSVVVDTASRSVVVLRAPR